MRYALRKMIYESSNYYAGVSQRLLSADKMLGKKRTGQIAKKYGFGKGIFWVGKGYQNGKSYPGISGFNHEGSAKAISRFYKTLLSQSFFNDYRGNTINETMKKILTGSKFANRFYGAVKNKGFSDKDLMRKSGSWTGNGAYSDSLAIKLQNDQFLIMTMLTQGKSCISHGSKGWHQLLVDKVFK